jgi:hypothetical protein
MLCQSTRIALSPCHLEPGSQQRAHPLPPATEASQDRKEERHREQQQEGRALIEDITRRPPADSPTTGATGEADQTWLGMDLGEIQSSLQRDRHRAGQD